MKVPTTCTMPDLNVLKLNTRNVLVLSLITGEIVGESAGKTAIVLPNSVDAAMAADKARLYQLLFVRLIEKATEEYERARLALITELQSIRDANRMYLGYGFTNHIENCINALCRLLKLEQRLTGGQSNQPVSNSSQLVDLRNTIEHMDERIAHDEVEQGRPITLAITDDEKGVVIGSVEGKFKQGGPKRTGKDCVLTFEDLAEQLRRLYQVGEKVVDKTRWFPT